MNAKVNLLKNREYAGVTGPTGPAGPKGAVEDAKEGEYTFRMTGPTGPTGRIETLEASNKKVEELLKPLLFAFENAKSPHYRVQKAKTSIIITKGAKGKGGVSFGFLHVGGEGKYERAEGIEIEIERIKDTD